MKVDKHTESSCYLALFGHRRIKCPTCEHLPPCPKCGKKDYMKVVSPTGRPDKFVRCYTDGCGHESDVYHTFQEAMEEFFGVKMEESENV